LASLVLCRWAKATRPRCTWRGVPAVGAVGGDGDKPDLPTQVEVNKLVLPMEAGVDPDKLALQTEVADGNDRDRLTPTVVRQNMTICSEECKIIGRRTGTLLKSLTEVANLVPEDAEYHSSLMSMVSDLRLEVFRNFRLMCQIVSTLAGREKNVRSCLKQFCVVAREANLPVQQINCKNLRENLRLLQKRAEEIKRLIESCEEPDKVLREKGDTKLVMKALENIKMFSGSEAVKEEAFDCMVEIELEIREVEDRKLAVVKRWVRLNADLTCQQNRVATCECRRNRRGVKHKHLMEHADELEEESRKVGKELEGWSRWIFPQKEDEHKKLRKMARSAREKEKLQANNCDHSEKKLSMERKEMKRLEEEVQAAKTELKSLESMSQEAKQRRRRARAHADKGLSGAAKLMALMQDLPGKLTADVGQKDTMLTAFKTYLDRDALLENALKSFSSAKTEQEAKVFFEALKPTIREYMETCGFVQPVVEELDCWLKPRVEVLADASTVEGSATTTALLEKQPFLLKLEEEEDDDDFR